MKKFLTMAVVLCTALMAVSCGSNKGVENPLIKGVLGEWHLTSWSGEMSEQIDVYVEFKEDNTFKLYQKDWQTPIYYTSYSGSYLITEDVISGKYSDGKSWGATNGYKASLAVDGKLTLVNVDNPDDISIFAPESIPSSIKNGNNSAVMTSRGEEVFMIERFL